jgi:UDP-N-acetyl-D-glucosamine dehydrogenase
MAQPEATLAAKIASRTATVGVVGLGYVGLPMVRAVHDAGYRVIGFDVDQTKVDRLRRGEAYLKHLGDDLTRQLAASDRFEPTSDPSQLGNADIIVLCVPTPLGQHHDPDLSFVENSTRQIARVLKPGALVSLESTSYPGTTREVCLPILEAAGRRIGHDCFLVFSPEREDPGRQGVSTRTIPRLVGGIDAASTPLGVAFYRSVVDQVFEVESAEVAEAAKLLENIYRAVNIALVNELKPVLSAMGIDVWRVIEAASTKPYGFQPFYPGPGWGGHCIPIDPFYLTWKAREVGMSTRFIELAGEINSRMPRQVVERVAEAINDDKKSLRGADVLVIGLAYKPDVDDVRETPAAEVIHLLLERGALVEYHDPHVPEFPKMRKRRFPLRSLALTPQLLERVDAVLIVTDHDNVDYAMVGHHARLVVDTRNAMARVSSPAARVVKA